MYLKTPKINFIRYLTRHRRELRKREKTSKNGLVENPILELPTLLINFTIYSNRKSMIIKSDLLIKVDQSSVKVFAQQQKYRQIEQNFELNKIFSQHFLSQLQNNIAFLKLNCQKSFNSLQEYFSPLGVPEKYKISEDFKRVRSNQKIQNLKKQCLIFAVFQDLQKQQNTKVGFKISELSGNGQIRIGFCHKNKMAYFSGETNNGVYLLSNKGRLYYSEGQRFYSTKNQFTFGQNDIIIAETFFETNKIKFTNLTTGKQIEVPHTLKRKEMIFCVDLLDDEQEVQILSSIELESQLKSHAKKTE